MFDPEMPEMDPDLEAQLLAESEPLHEEPPPESPSGFQVPGEAPSFSTPMEPATASEIFLRDLPPDNEHGDGVRNPTLRPCAGIKGDGLLTPKIFSKAEDWKDYNYSDFSY